LSSSPWQARLAPDLVSLLQAHGQPLDPNLVRLAEAWKEAEAQIAAAGGTLPAGEEGDEEEEEEEEDGGGGGGRGGVAEDLEVGLQGWGPGCLLGLAC
jgi:hypothetical protein